MMNEWRFHEGKKEQQDWTKGVFVNKELNDRLPLLLPSQLWLMDHSVAARNAGEKNRAHDSRPPISLPANCSSPSSLL